MSTDSTNVEFVHYLFDFPKTTFVEVDPDPDNPIIRIGVAVAFKVKIDLPNPSMMLSLHGPLCTEPSISACTRQDDCPTSEVVQFWNERETRVHEQTDEHVASTLLVSYIAKFSGMNLDYACFPDEPQQSFALSLLPIEGYKTTASAVAKSFELLQNFFETLRHSNMSKFHRFSMDSLHPVYFLIFERKDRKLGLKKAIVIQGDLSISRNSRRNTDDPKTVFWYYEAIHNELPMTKYLGFELDARNSLEVFGDYQDAIVKMAIAVEILVKNLAICLFWEEHNYPNKYQKANMYKGNLLYDKPIDIMTGLISSQLGGNWDRKKRGGSPVSDWYNNIKRTRDLVAHVGISISREQAELGMISLEKIRKHCLDRLAANSKRYPVSGIIFLGSTGISSRRLLDQYREVLQTHNILKESKKLDEFIKELISQSKK